MTGHEVVLEHAPAAAAVDGEDPRVRLLRRAQVLRLLGAVDEVVVPTPHAVLAHRQDLFLVRTWLPGISLRQWVTDVVDESPDLVGVPPDRALPMAHRLISTVAAVHRAGYVLRDLSPASVLVGPGDLPALADLQAITRVGSSDPPRADVLARLRDTGYLAPEVGFDPTRPAAVTEDLYGLGALLFLLATGSDPSLAEDDPEERRSTAVRLASWLAVAARDGETAWSLAPAAGSLLADLPAARCSLATTQARLIGGPTIPGAQPSASLPTAAELLTGGLAELTAAMTPDAHRLWPAGPAGEVSDPCDVQHGAAGVLAVLVRSFAGDPDQAEVIRKAAAWLDIRSVEATSSPGLYSGRAGIAWVLAEAGRALDEPQYLERATELALTMPSSWLVPGIADGLAGATLTHLHLANFTGDARLLDQAEVCARALRDAAVSTSQGPTWPIPDKASSPLAGHTQYGFAHGVAGVGYALLATGLVLQLPAYVQQAIAAGDLLCRTARLDETGAVWWPVGPSDATRTAHWCDGASGIGSFLVRLFEHTGQERFAESARAAAGAVLHSCWRSSSATCHGLAGNGQFLLDVARTLGDSTYRACAEDLVPLLAIRCCRRSGRVLVPDETGLSITADYQAGLAGIVAYLLRLQHGGRRPFVLDDLLAAPHRWHVRW